MKISRSFTLVVITVAFVCFASQQVAAKDEWIQVRSKNFYLIGNASEKDIRKVARRLEQFRETFRELFGHMNLTSPIATNVVVFRNDASYKNFKPKRADGKIDTFVAGYFQSGEDVNYITLSVEGEDAEIFQTIFHEYVHFIVNTNFGKSEVPPWFNEGLAEYYSTFAIEDDIKVKLGLPLSRHLELLQESKLMPLDALFKVSNFQLLQTADHSRSIFYAESWALIHYLLQSGKSDPLSKFLDQLLANVPPDKAFQDAFSISPQQMEAELRAYVSKSKYQYYELIFTAKLTFDADMQASPLDEANTNAYLGDLLAHTNRPDDAEPYLVNALKLKPDLSMANTTLGMVKMEQRKFDEAKTLLEKAVAGDQKNHLALYRYAFLLSREGRDEMGYVTHFDKDTAAKMRDALRKAIAINPAFTESYEMLAFVDVVNLEELDDAFKMMQTALRYQPGNQRYAIRMAEVLSRQDKLDEAHDVAERIARTADDAEVKHRAEELLAEITEHKAYNDRVAAERKSYEERSAARSGSGVGPPKMAKRIEGGKQPTEAEAARQQAEASLRAINESLRRPAEGEQRVLGHVQKIDCRVRPIAFTVKTPTETFTVTSKDFNALTLNTFDPAANNVNVGCEANLSAFNAIVTYHAGTAPHSTSRGELKSLEFVDANFRFMTDEEMSNATLVVYDEPDTASKPKSTPDGPPRPSAPADMDARRHAAMMQGIKDALLKPADGEKREMGFLDKIECTKKEPVFYLRTATQTLRLLNSSPQSLKIIVYPPDLEGLQFGCTLKPVEFPVVFIYSDKPDPKTKTAGEILSLEFVPKGFVMEQ